MKKILTFLTILLLTSATAEDFAFKTATAQLTLDDRGFCTSLRDTAGGAEWILEKPEPFFALRKNGGTFPVTKLMRNGSHWRAEFGAASVTADLQISTPPDFIRIQLIRLSSPDIESLELAHLALRPLKRTGSWLGAVWDERFAIALLGLSDCVNVTAGGTLDLAVDFDLEHIIAPFNHGGQTYFTMRPRLFYYDMSQVGAIAGTVNPAQLCQSIAAQTAPTPA